MANVFAYNIYGLEVSKTKEWYLITSLLSELFETLSYCIMFYVFYTVVHVVKDRITNMSTKVSTTIKYVHLVVVGLFAALVIIEWSYMVLYINSVVHNEYIFIEQASVESKIDTARCILFWLAAWEIVGWTFYLGLMTSRGSSKVNIKVCCLLGLRSQGHWIIVQHLTPLEQMSAYFLIAASGFFLGENFYYFLWDVIYKLRTGNTDVGSATDIIQEIVRFVFVQGSFFGLILCYWRFPAPEARFDEISSEENREARISSDFVDRTGLAPREVEGSTPLDGITDKKAGMFEADTSRAILEADGSDYSPDKKAGISEVDGSKGILEADSKLVHEAAS